MVFTRWGGSFNYANSINWENFGKTQDEFLNEAIIDDIQALTRAYRLHERVKNAKGLNINLDQIHTYAQHVANKEIDSDKLTDYLKKEAAGAKIPKPKQVFLVIAESYAQWPLMDKYEHVGIANGLKYVLKQDNTIHVPAFIPDGPFTAMAVTGVVSGLANIHLYITDELQSFKQPYITAIAPQMKKLGYKTYFWYGGFSSWERIKDFTLAQGFDNFYSYGDFQKTKGNVWGVDDGEFLQSISEVVNPEEWSFHVILTTSNHAPYTVQLKTVGFDDGLIPARYRSNKDLVEVLGHFWYADKAIGDFIMSNYHKNPASLFIITGDHADRTSLDPNPTFYERYSVPCIIYGTGITKDMIPGGVAGNHIHIAPTLFELIAPQGFEYYSVGKSLTQGNHIGINHEFWITPDFIGRIGNSSIQRLPWRQGNEPFADTGRIQQDVEAMRAVSWWQVKHGEYLTKSVIK